MKARQNRPLNLKQEEFCSKVATGMTASQAARETGYGKEYAKRAADRLIRNNPRIKARIEEIKKELRDGLAITRENRVNSILLDMELARTHKNMNAVMKGQELIGKMGGLLIDRVEVAHVSVAAALEEARARAAIKRDALPIIDVPAEPVELLPAPTRARVNVFD